MSTAVGGLGYRVQDPFSWAELTLPPSEPADHAQCRPAGIAIPPTGVETRAYLLSYDLRPVDVGGPHRLARLTTASLMDVKWVGSRKSAPSGASRARQAGWRRSNASRRRRWANQGPSAPDRTIRMDPTWMSVIHVSPSMESGQREYMASLGGVKGNGSSPDGRLRPTARTRSTPDWNDGA